MKISVPFTALSIAFCLCFIIDAFLELKVISLFGLPITAGLFVIAISYIVSDCLVEVYGYQKARLVMWLTFIAHFVTVMMLQIACWLPPLEAWAGEEHFQFIFGMTPRITIASMIAFLVGSSTNAYIMSKLKYIWRGSKFKIRAFVSTVFGELFDSATFFPIAFGGLLPIESICMMILVQASGKIAYETLCLPITSRVVSYIKRKEGIDIIDENISYNIFKISC